MNKFLEKIEHYNSRLIPFAILMLLIVIVFELFVKVENPTFLLIVKIMDYLVITIFVIDLIFLAIKAKSVKFFFRNYWLDILAVFPFVLFFNVVGIAFRALEITERFLVSQAILHETLEAGKGIRVLNETGKLGRILRIIVRGIRIITKSGTLTGLSEKHKLARKKVKEVKKSKKHKRNRED